MLDFTPKHEFLIGIDCDGCAFDTMELKHKECFIPQIINHYGLQGVSKYAREAAEFVNLYSKSRGINRFPALIETLEWLQKRPEVQARGVKITMPEGLVEWLKVETKLANPALAKAADSTGDPDLKQALAWCKAVNDAVEKIVRWVPPFPYLRESLEKLKDKADLLVVSATPNEALEARVGRARSGEIRGGHLRPGNRHQERIVGGLEEVPAEPYADDRRRPGRLQSGPGATTPCSSRSTPARKRPVGSAFTTKGSTAFSPARSPANISNNLLAEFDSYLPERPPWERMKT